MELGIEHLASETRQIAHAAELRPFFCQEVGQFGMGFGPPDAGAGRYASMPQYVLSNSAAHGGRAIPVAGHACEGKEIFIDRVGFERWGECAEHAEDPIAH